MREDDLDAHHLRDGEGQVTTSPSTSPATVDQPAFDVRETDGKVEVRRRTRT